MPAVALAPRFCCCYGHCRCIAGSGSCSRCSGAHIRWEAAAATATARGLAPHRSRFPRPFVIVIAFFLHRLRVDLLRLGAVDGVLLMLLLLLLLLRVCLVAIAALRKLRPVRHVHDVMPAAVLLILKDLPRQRLGSDLLGPDGQALRSLDQLRCPLRRSPAHTPADGLDKVHLVAPQVEPDGFIGDLDDLLAVFYGSSSGSGWRC